MYILAYIVASHIEHEDSLLAQKKHFDLKKNICKPFESNILKYYIF